MMKKHIFILTILLLALSNQMTYGNLFLGFSSETANEEVHFSVLNGNIKMTLRRTDSDFQCIGIQYSDKYLNMVVGTCLELKREGDFYVVNIKYEPMRFKNLDKAIEEYLKDLLLGNYKREGVPDGVEIWKAFIKDGGLRKFTEIAKGWMDDEYLDSPWNTIYG